MGLKMKTIRVTLMESRKWRIKYSEQNRVSLLSERGVCATIALVLLLSRACTKLTWSRTITAIFDRARHVAHMFFFCRRGPAGANYHNYYRGSIRIPVRPIGNAIQSGCACFFKSIYIGHSRYS